MRRELLRLAQEHTTALFRRLGQAYPPRPLARERIGELCVEVRDRAGFREMVARSADSELVWTRTNLSDPGESGWPYVELLHLAAIQAKARQRALFIGCGGAVALRQFAGVYPGIGLDLVEREARVIELARAWYGLDDIPGLTVHVADGADFATRAPAASWDILVVDAFDGSSSSAALSCAPFLSAARRLLRAGGALALNLLGTLDGQGSVAAAVRQLSRSFHRIRVVPVMGANERYCPSDQRNIVLIASR
jgi:spermidine synthase